MPAGGCGRGGRAPPAPHAGSATLTTELAISFARLPENARPAHWAARLTVVRGFARYLQTVEPATEVPPLAVFPARRHRPVPYLWSVEDIDRLLEAAKALRPPLRAATYETLFGLLAVSGMRVGEAVGLTPATTSPSSRCGSDTSR